MLVNRTKQKLREEKPVFGVVVQFDDPFITEAIGAAGFDFIVIDCQHAPTGEEKIFAMTRGFAPTESDVIVRVVYKRDLANKPGARHGSGRRHYPAAQHRGRCKACRRGRQIPADGHQEQRAPQDRASRWKHGVPGTRE